MPTNFLFVGNPGTGKSTLINCMLGEHKCESGLSFGSGKTFTFEKHYDDEGNVFMDTPGLADTEIQAEAAKQITLALREGGDYKLFFMVRLWQGRVVQDDIATIHKVLDSIDPNVVPEVSFSVLVNQVQELQYKMIMTRGKAMERVVTSICSGNYTTKHIEFIPILRDLNERDNAVIKLPDALVNFIKHQAPLVEIPPVAVNVIDTDAAAFKEMLEALRDMIAELNAKNAELERKIDELNGSDSDFWSTVGGIAAGLFAGFLMS